MKYFTKTASNVRGYIIKKTLTGAGVGAVVGGTTSAIKSRGEKGQGKKILKGALVGAGAGAGVGAAYGTGRAVHSTKMIKSHNKLIKDQAASVNVRINDVFNQAIGRETGLAEAAINKYYPNRRFKANEIKTKLQNGLLPQQEARAGVTNNIASRIDSLKLREGVHARSDLKKLKKTTADDLDFVSRMLPGYEVAARKDAKDIVSTSLKNAYKKSK